MLLVNFIKIIAMDCSIILEEMRMKTKLFRKMRKGKMRRRMRKKKRKRQENLQRKSKRMRNLYRNQSVKINDYIQSLSITFVSI